MVRGVLGIGMAAVFSWGAGLAASQDAEQGLLRLLKNERQYIADEVTALRLQNFKNERSCRDLGVRIEKRVAEVRKTAMELEECEGSIGSERARMDELWAAAGGGESQPEMERVRACIDRIWRLVQENLKLHRYHTKFNRVIFAFESSIQALEQSSNENTRAIGRLEKRLSRIDAGLAEAQEGGGRGTI